MRRGIPVLVVAILIAGCGGGGESTSNADFVAEANQICKEDNAKFKAVGQPQGSDLRPYLAKLVPVQEEDLSRLDGVTPPDDKADLYDSWISDIEDGTNSTKEAADAASADEASKVLEANASNIKGADAKAKELGLDQCVSGASL